MGMTTMCSHGESMRPNPCMSTLSWYAIHTIAKHEKNVTVTLNEKGICSFVPTLRQMRRWSDRRKLIEVLLFSCYVFVRAEHGPVIHQAVLRTPGVLRWIGVNGTPTAIPDAEIEAVRSAVSSNMPVSPHHFLKVGQRVRIRGGCMDGVEGLLVNSGADLKVVVSVNLIQQSLAISLEGYDVEAV